MEFGELLNQFLIDLQSLFRTHTKSLNLTLPQIMLLSSIPTDGIDMTSLSHRLGIDNSTLTRLINYLIYILKQSNETMIIFPLFHLDLLQVFGKIIRNQNDQFQIQLMSEAFHLARLSSQQ